jgi:hypothetical protein
MLGNIHRKNTLAAQRVFMVKGGRGLRTGRKGTTPTGPIAAAAAALLGRGS